MRFLIGLLLGLLIGGVLTVLATGNAGRALQSQLQQQVRDEAVQRSPSPRER